MDREAEFDQLEAMLKVDAEIAGKIALLTGEDRQIFRRISDHSATPTDFARAPRVQGEIANLDERRERLRQEWRSARVA